MEIIKPNADLQWLTSHFSPENSKWLAENVEGVNQSLKQLLELADEDLNSASNDTDASSQRNPELIARIDKFSFMHQSLAQKYINLIGNLHRNISNLPLMQPPQITDSALHQATIYHTPHQKIGLNKPEHQPIAFDLFLSSGGDTTDVSLKDGFESTSSVSSFSDSESFSAPTTKERVSFVSGEKKIEMETELVGAKFEDELRALNEKLKLSEEEVLRLKAEIENAKSVTLLVDGLQAELDMEKKKKAELESQTFDLGCEIAALGEELKMTGDKLERSEQENSKLNDEFLSKYSQSKNHQMGLEKRLEAARKEMSLLVTNLDFEKSQVLDLQEKLLMYFADIDIIRNANEKSSLEKEKLQLNLTSLLEQKILLESRIEESELKTKFSEHEKLEMRTDIENLKEELKKKSENFETLEQKHNFLMDEKDSARADVDALKETAALQESEAKKMEDSINNLTKSNNELFLELENVKMLTHELRFRVEELEKDADYRAEEKRAAIRELCFILEHYRTGYKELREAFIRQTRH